MIGGIEKPKIKEPTIGWSLFGTEKANYVCLTSIDIVLWDSKPKHALDIPENWQSFFEGHFKIGESDFGCRAAALRQCAHLNQKAIDDSPEGDGVPDNWTLIFHLGTWGSGSFLWSDFSQSHLSINTQLSLVQPTPKEVKDFAKAKAA